LAKSPLSLLNSSAAAVAEPLGGKLPTSSQESRPGGHAQGLAEAALPQGRAVSATPPQEGSEQVCSKGLGRVPGSKHAPGCVTLGV